MCSSKKANLILIASFLCLLSVSIANDALHFLPNRQSQEKRPIVSLPPLTLKDIARYPARFTEFYNDNFSFRNDLIFFNYFIRGRFLRWLSETAFVIFGEEDWLFFYPPERSESFLGGPPFSDGELAALRANILKRSRYFSKKGIDYLLLVAPNKQTIYPEYLPRYLRSRPRAVRLNQLRGLAGLPFLDVREALIFSKKIHPVYYQSDTHWNDYGAFIAYEEIIRRLAGRHPGLGESAVLALGITTEKIVAKGDLAKMSTLGKRLKDNKITIKCVASRTPCPLRMVLVGDSFIKYLFPYFRMQFKECSLMERGDPVREGAFLDRANIVVEEISERLLDALLEMK